MTRREYLQLLVTLATVRAFGAHGQPRFEPDVLTTESGESLGLLIEPLTDP
jgi:hypothetical protein